MIFFFKFQLIFKYFRYNQCIAFYQTLDKITNYYYIQWLIQIQNEQQIHYVKSQRQSYLMKTIGIKDISKDMIAYIYSFLKVIINPSNNY